MTVGPTLELKPTDRGTGWRLAFEKIHGQYQHHVQWMHRGKITPILSSVQSLGSNSDYPTTPASPPLQQLTTESRDANGSVAMGIGMASKNYWSGAFRWLNRQPILKIEIACRVNQSLPHLASTYQICANVDFSTDQRGALRLNGSFGWMRVVALAGARLIVSDATNHFEIQTDEVSDRTPLTVQWEYTIEVGNRVPVS